MKSQPSLFLGTLPGVRWIMAFFLALIFATQARAGSPPLEVPLITNIDQLKSDFPGVALRSQVTIRLPAMVLIGGGVSSVVRIDGSFTLYQLGAMGTELKRGDLILLSGAAMRDGTNLDLNTERFIDNDGAHSMYEKMAGAWLEAGDQPLRVDYFNFVGDRGLIFSMQSVGQPLTPVADDVLFHLQTNRTTGAISKQPGLAYSCYNGAWVVMPDFDSLEPFRSGVCRNFDITRAGLQTGYAMEFSGLLHIPERGYYVFSCESDDGSTVSLGRQSLVAQVVGRKEFSPLPVISAGQSIAGQPDRFCASVQGIVTFAITDTADPIIELTGSHGRTQVGLRHIDRFTANRLMGCNVGVEGVCQRVFTSEGLPVAGRIDPPGSEQLTMIEFSPALRHLPSVHLDAALEYARTNGLQLIRVVGTFRQEKGGPGWRFEDESASVALSEVLGCPVQDGGQAEIAGQITLDRQHQPRLNGLGRAVQTPPPNAPPAALTTIEEVKQMTREQAKRGYPVHVRGVITFVWPNAGFFLQDATRSIEVRMKPEIAATTPMVGDYWEVEGETFAEFAPDIQATNAALLGKGMLPDPIKPSWQQLIDGSLDTQYVEIQGVVSRADGSTVNLLTRGGRLAVQLPELAPEDLAGRQGALLRIRGCLIPGRDIATQQVKIGEFSLRNASISVDRPAPSHPFALPQKHAADLLLFESHASPIEPVRLRGVFLQQWGGTCYVVDGSTGVRVELMKSAAALHRGDIIDMVGYPDYNGPSLRLQDAVIQRAGASSLPQPPLLSADHLLDDGFDSTLATLKGVFVSRRGGEGEQILEMRSGTRLWQARFPSNGGTLPSLALGSELALTGVYAGIGGDRPAGRQIDSFELLLSVPADVVVLHRPSWWTPQHTLALATALLAALGLAAIWIWMLRRRVEERTGELQQEVERHLRTELALQEKTKLLTRENDERVRMQAEIERGHKQLLITSRQAGMAEVATSVLHNVGNVLTSVNVLGSSIADHVRNSKVTNVSRLAAVFDENKADMAQFITVDSRGRKVPEYVAHLGARLSQEQADLLNLVRTLNDNIEHINEIVATQQAYAKISGVLERITSEEVLEDALRMHGESLKRHGVQLLREYSPTAPITMDRHKVLQILFNLLENAKHACIQAGGLGRTVIVSLKQARNSVNITVADNGVGIAPEIIGRLFSQGFSTRQNGHGFGLHSSILAAQDMGGTLSVHSDGPGKGAVFTLVLPLNPPEPAPMNSRKGAAFKTGS